MLDNSGSSGGYSPSGAMSWMDFGYGNTSNFVNSAIADYHYNKNAEKANTRTAQLQQLFAENEPSWQMTGFSKAGLNPMLIYKNLNFHGAPSVQGWSPDYSSGSANQINAISNSRTAQANSDKSQQEIINLKQGLRLIVEQTDLVNAQLNTARMNTALTTIELHQAQALVDAMSKTGGGSDIDYSSPRGLMNYYNSVITQPEVARALSDIQSSKNDEEFHKLFNSKELGVAGQVLSGVLNAFRVFRPSGGGYTPSPRIIINR